MAVPFDSSHSDDLAAIDGQRRKLGAAETTDPNGREAIRRSFLSGYRTALWIAVALAVASAASAAALIDGEPRAGS